MIIQHETKDCIGKTENISVPLDGKFTDTNSFKLLIGGLCSDNANDGIYYIDNIRLVTKTSGADTPTNINLQSISNRNAQERFSIGGQRVNGSYHGIVIINGKKVVVK